MSNNELDIYVKGPEFDLEVDLSTLGSQCVIYDLRYVGADDTEQGRFFANPVHSATAELKAELEALNGMLNDAVDRTGITERMLTSREKYNAVVPVKSLRYEGGVLRLFCCLYSPNFIVITNGSIKNEDDLTIQSVPDLDAEFKKTIEVSDMIYMSQKSKDLILGDDMFYTPSGYPVHIARFRSI